MLGHLAAPNLWMLGTLEGPNRQSPIASVQRTRSTLRVVKTVFLENGVFAPHRKTGDFDEKWRKWRFTFYPQKQGVALLRGRKPTKVTKMAGVPQTKPGFSPKTGFAPRLYHSTFEITYSGFILRGPQMGGQIRRGRIWRAHMPIFKGFWDLWTEIRGAPKNAKFNHDGSDPPLAALWYSGRI